MGEETAVVEELRARVRELEDKVEALRISRRVLMNLIDTLEKEKRDQLDKLSSQNEKLQQNNCRYARTIMHRNIRITELEEQLRLLHAGKNRTGNTFT
ncbi:MAG: translation initiation factor 2 [Sporomusaceae bacterium]|nr:translation initiation factor 2 [Sporomusaceae bacterium]